MKMGLSRINCGPGEIPCIMKMLNSRAMARLPGMPKLRVVSSAPPSLESLAASLAMTPSGWPVPKEAGSLEDCTATV